MNYHDLKKLVHDKDSRKKGLIDYGDFSKWLGNTIHMSEGFYFRHDSVKNPQFDSNMKKKEKMMQQSAEIIAKNIENEKLLKMVLEKV